MSIKNTKIKVTKAASSKISEVDFSNLAFGEVFTDHMFECDYVNGEWVNAEIKPYGPLLMDPSARVLHYGQAVFEGMKAYKSEDDTIWMFRPEENFQRINKSSVRLAIPEFPKDLFFDGLETLLNIDSDWIQKGDGNSMYIRPFVFATQAGVSASPSNEYKFIFILSPAQSYYSGDVRVVFAQEYSRAANGGVGFAKAAGNYAAQFYPQKLAVEEGYQQIVWTDASTHEYLEEAGTMNVFFRINDTLITTPISDRILDGITRKSIIQLAKDSGIQVEERKIAVHEVEAGAKSGELKEIFGSGTATVINPIKGFGFKGNDYELPVVEDSYASMLKTKIINIQLNKSEDPYGWRYKVREI